MSEFTTMLERVSDRVAPPSDAFERLTKRRCRKHRNRRFAAGVLALVVAIAGIGGVYFVFHQTRHTVPVSGASNFHAIFPAFNSVEARSFQAALDKGWDPRLGSETAVAERFAIDILGWQPDRFRVQLDQPGSVRMSLIPACWSTPGADCPSWSFSVRLELAQLVREGPGGAWFVTRAETTLTKLDLEPGQNVRAGSRITARVNLPNGMRVLAGYSYLGQSAQVFPVHPVLVHSGLVTFRVATQDFASSTTHGPGGGSTSIGGGGPSALTHPVSGIVSVAILDAPRSHWDDPFGEYFTKRVVAIRDLGVPFGMNQGGPSGISFRSVTAVPVRFVPAGSASTDYFIRLPAEPGAVDSKGLTVLDADTNLPEGTRIWLYFSSKDSEGPAEEEVAGGTIRIRVANDECHGEGAMLTGSNITVRVTASPADREFILFGPVGPGPQLSSPQVVATPSIWPSAPQQPEAVLAILGQHFENLTGPQVTLVGEDNQIQVSREYQLPANTCTERIVYLPGGDFRQVPVTPSP
jgi:hypothetical protein